MLLKTKRRPNLAGVARAAGVLLCVWLCLLAFGAGAVRADLNEMMLGLGGELMRYEGARQQGEAHALTLNGAVLEVSSGMSERSLSAVLDDFEARCAAHDGQLGRQIEDAERQAAESGVEGFSVESSVLDATMREDDGQEGYVACFDMGDGPRSPDDILARVEDFVATGDLSRVGGLRYVYAEQTETGTHFVTFASTGELPVMAMFPAEGDAPGADVPGVPRPPGSRRLLSATDTQAPVSMTMFVRSDLDVDGMERFYRESLTDSGFSLLEDEENPFVSRDGATALVAERDDTTYVIVLGTDPDGGSVASILTARDAPVTL